MKRGVLLLFVLVGCSTTPGTSPVEDKQRKLEEAAIVVRVYRTTLQAQQRSKADLPAVRR